MKLSRQKSAKGKLILEIKDASEWFANTLRRLCIAEVPTLAIELVEIHKNDAITYDEILSHRLGLIPLTTDLAGYKLATEEEFESQEFLAQSSVKFTLHAKGPCVVHAKDLKGKDPKVKPVYGEMPIVKLLEGQEVELEATAVLGQGRRHAKWSPCHAYFRRLEEPKEGETATSFLFTLESWGQLSPEEIVESAIEQHNQQLKEFEKLLAEVK